MGGSFSVENDLRDTIEVKHFTTGGGIALQGKANKRGEPVVIEKGCEAIITEEVAQGSFYYIEVHVVGSPVKAGTNYYSMGDKKIKASEILKKGGARPPKRDQNGDVEPATPIMSFDPTNGIEPFEGPHLEAVEKVVFMAEITKNSFSPEEDLDTPTGSTVILPCTIQQLWHILLSDQSGYTNDYHVSRNDENIQIGPWAKTDQFGGMRVMNCIGSTPFGPKSYTEAHRFAYSKEGGVEKLSFHRSGQVPDIMYGASFRTESFHMFTGEDGQVKMYSKARVNWVDSCPKLLKMTIEKSGLKELKKAGKPIDLLVAKYVNKHVNPGSPGTGSTSAPSSNGSPARKSKRQIRSPDSGKPGDAAPQNLIAGLPIKHLVLLLTLICFFSMFGAFVGATFALSSVRWEALQ